MNSKKASTENHESIHWTIFSQLQHEPAGPVGRSPLAWVSSLGLTDVPCRDLLPVDRIDRLEVRRICRNLDLPVLFGYVCTMAWGGQGAGTNRGHARTAWAERDRIAEALVALRSGGLSRAESYALFQKNDGIKGLGPSFWTKLLYFFPPETDRYIMDQWTAKSVNLITGRKIVQLSGGCPPRTNTPDHYNRFCEEVDRMAQRLGLKGEQVEEMMMSRGGRKPAPWRQHVRGNTK